MKSDIEIAQEAKMKPIADIAASLGLADEDVIPYGRYKAKVNHRLIHKASKQGKLILVTAISPTPAGEGKTTTSVGLADAMNAIGKKTMLCLREPSLGPVFGMKGGAAGGGYAQVVPMEDINLHFTGDIHAIGTANNLLAAMIDNSIQQGNPLNIDPRRITWKRCMDMNDRQLRFIVDGLGGKVNGTPREDGFDITVASEIMAIFCLATSISDLKERLSKIVCAYTYDGKPVTAGEIGAAGAMTALLKDALDPNLVQTLENNPAIIHGGPFANIAHGCNSVMATKLSLSLADYVITEAGFGADLGAEKFLDIKCRYAGIAPSACVLVATLRALKSHGGVAKADLNTPNLEAVKKGAANLVRHIDNMKNGQCDAVFVTSGLPNATVMDLGVQYDMVIVPIDGEGRDKLVAEYPYYAKSVIPAGTYNNTEDVEGLFVYNIMLVRKDLSDAMVYDMLEGIFQNISTIKASHNAADKNIDITFGVDDIQLPLHPGAEAFWKDNGYID